MAKIILHPMVDHLSGTLKDARYYQYGGKQIVANYTPYQLPDSTIKQDNARKAFSIVMKDYQILKGEYPKEYESWVQAADNLEKKLKRAVTVTQLYTAYFLTRYHSELGIDVEPNLLISHTGYGRCAYGTGLYGNSGECHLYHYDNRIKRVWIGYSHRPGYGTGGYGTGKFGVIRHF